MLTTQGKNIILKPYKTVKSLEIGKSTATDLTYVFAPSYDTKSLVWNNPNNNQIKANSLVFTICTVTIAFLINNIVNDKNAINGIVNVVALGSSFLSGAFVPVEMLPNSVLTCARILPSYWYIQTNELLKSVETFNIDTLKPIIINMSIILGFSVIFIVIANVISKKKRKIA